MRGMRPGGGDDGLWWWEMELLTWRLFRVSCCCCCCDGTCVVVLLKYERWRFRWVGSCWRCWSLNLVGTFLPTNYSLFSILLRYCNSSPQIAFLDPYQNDPLGAASDTSWRQSATRREVVSDEGRALIGHFLLSLCASDQVQTSQSNPQHPLLQPLVRGTLSTHKQNKKRGIFQEKEWRDIIAEDGFLFSDIFNDSFQFHKNEWHFKEIFLVYTVVIS